MTQKALGLSERKREVLRDAASRLGGWALFKPRTTEKLAGLGFFTKEKHPVYGMQWRITEAGRAALS